jgi:tRNA pseudouridine55 synthase
VRSLARDIAHAFNACGYVSALRRTAIGKFSIDSANIIDGKTILDYNPLHLREDKLLPLTSVLDDILVLEVSEYDAGKLKNGMKISIKDASFSNPLVALTCNNVLIALVSVDRGMAQPQRVFNL